MKIMKPCMIVWMVAVLAAASTVFAEDRTVDPGDVATVDADELLEATPVDEDIDIATGEPISRTEMQPLTPETLPPGEPYPIGNSHETVVSPAARSIEPQPTGTPTASHSVHQFFPYTFSAYIPAMDATELDLGLLLNAPPGIEAGLSWGAVEAAMVSAKLTVQGASYASGIQLRYALRNEEPAETHPAIAIHGGWRYMNHRTDGDERLNLFRGNRFTTGVIVSKWMGSMAEALDAKPSVKAFLDYFTLHVEALIEYQTGRKNPAEDAYAGVEVGARAALEIEIDPQTVYLNLVYDSLPDWIGVENYYIGVRYFAREKFAVDVVGGRIYGDYGVNIGLAWLF